MKIIIKTGLLSLSIFIASYSITTLAQSKQVVIPETFKPEREELISDLATKRIKNKINPLTKETLEKIKDEVKEKKKSMTAPLFDPELRNRQIQMDVSPEQKEVKINLSPNYSTIISFFDKNGNPWDIERYLIAENLFDNDKFRPNMLKISPKLENSSLVSNIQVLLKDAKYILTLKTSHNYDVVDNIVSVTMTSLSPDSIAKQQDNIQDRLLSNAKFDNPEYISFIDGIGEKAERRSVYVKEGHDSYESNLIEAWEKNDFIILRMAQGAVISPDVFSAKQDTHGNNIYMVDKSYAPDIVVSTNGLIFSIEVK
jgi:hypothetical protein